MNKNNYKLKEYLPGVVRIDYTKIQHKFKSPNLLEMQVKAYDKFLKFELEEIIKSYFPIVSASGKYRVEFVSLKFLPPERTEVQAHDEGKNYESTMYADLRLVDTETGSVKKVKSSNKKKDLPDGIFFSRIPLITDKGSFIINGIEKFVIAQIVRSPGAYISNKMQMKLSNSRKKIQEGYVCEMLPAKGILMFIYIGEHKDFVQVILRDSAGESAKVFPVTVLLKAFGLNEEEIRRLYSDNKYILNTLKVDKYNRDTILEEQEINNSIKEYFILHKSKEKILSKSLPIDKKIRQLIVDYISVKEEMEDIENKFDETKDAKLKEAIQEKQERLNKIIDSLIIEKCAKVIIDELSISVKETNRSAGEIEHSYQKLLWNTFFVKRKYDLSNAGRYKFVRKLRISERLYKHILAEDLKTKDGNILFKKGKLILKDEINKIKQLISKENLDLTEHVNPVESIYGEQKLVCPKMERISVYASDEMNSEPVSILGVDGNDLTTDVLTLSDIVSVISYIIGLPYNIGYYDDIDHLENKRLKLINELLRGRIQTGMARIEKYVKDRLAIADGSNKVNLETLDGMISEISQDEKPAKLTVKSIINTKPFQLVIKDFFNTYQLIQFLDQQNPLAELTNKRRISAMGPDGISRDDPNLDIRDVHYSHYGRICPIETPEGMNIGLIMSLAFFATIDKNGFLMAPYRKVENGFITDKYENLTAAREEEYVIAYAESTLDIEKNGEIKNKQVIARYRSAQELFDSKKIDYIDIAPRQVVSIGASLIPFLENDDGSRALMGANMQRQAVPLLNPYAPIVGTGSEFKIAHESGMMINAKKSGKVIELDSKHAVIKNDDGTKSTYNFLKFGKSNQDSCYNQSPIVNLGQRVEENQPITNGPAISNSELALGQNVLVGFTTWGGYNYEDAIILSDRLVKEDIYTSVTIDEYTVQCLRTKSGDEEISRDIPNVSESAKRYLDENGIILIGAEVKEGDILVGKFSPKSQANLSAEEKLLQVIFGEKSSNVRDSSLKVPHGGEGIVCDIKHFSVYKGNELDDDVLEVVKVYVAQKRKIQIGDKMAGRHGNKGTISKIVPVEDMPHFEDGTPLDILLNPLGVPSRMNIGQIFELHLGYAIRQISKKWIVEYAFNNDIEQIRKVFPVDEYHAKLIVKKVKEFAKLHDYKTVNEAVKNIRLIDLQLLLKNIGLSLDDINLKVATPVFEGVDRESLESIMKDADIDPETTKGKFTLIDGKTGEKFANPISVGIMYMLKLNHMVDDKIHSRVVGPYSKITQQPLGGKSQNGGQRFGEMEVWALEAYGASYNLREILTIKSDDVKGRNQTYNAIIKGKPIPEPGLPESFKLLTKMIQGLAMQISIIKKDDTNEDINAYTAVNDTDDEIDEMFSEEFLYGDEGF